MQETEAMDKAKISRKHHQISLKGGRDSLKVEIISILYASPRHISTLVHSCNFTLYSYKWKYKVTLYP